MSFPTLAACAALLFAAFSTTDAATPTSAPLTIGETFTIGSATLREQRRINVYRPPGEKDEPLPVLYMPDGGISEDFLHAAGLVQISVANGTMRPFLLVGIENTERRRDLTGPTRNAEDRKIAPRVGGSAAFRAFIRDELMPEIERRYRTTQKTAIFGESLAGLFVIEIFLLEPVLFDTYIAVDPSLWWNDGALTGDAAKYLPERFQTPVTLYLASSEQQELAEAAARLVAQLSKEARPGLQLQHERMPDEQHGTVFHPALLKAFRAVFAPSVSH